MPDLKVVLLVDDDEFVRRAVKRTLGDSGAEVVEASDGAQALELLRGGLRPAVIVSDVDMPVMSGLLLAKHCKEEFPDIPMILVSGGGHERAAADLGVTYFEKGSGSTKDLKARVLAAL